MRLVIALLLLMVSFVAYPAPHRGVLKVSSGQEHACALMADHRVSCWGIGNPTPQPAPDIGDIVDVASGNGFTCQLRLDKTVWCWGANSAGQLGNGTTTASDTAVEVKHQLTLRVVPLTDVIAISAGDTHACALLSDNTMWCWGQNADGELGNHYVSSFSSLAVKVIVDDGSDAPLNVASMTAGASHTCAALSDGSGTGACWGYNKLGQLANTSAGDRTDSPHSVIAPDGSKLGLFGMSGGALHTCALLPDDTDGNSIACWGDNEAGELGNPYEFMSWTSTPSPVVFPDGKKLSFLISVSAGNSFTCALLAADGSVACWGSNIYGQLGNHSVVADYSINPVPVKLDSTTLTDFLDLSLGGEHACVVQFDSTDPAPQPGVKCWGHNSSGQLGIGVVDSSRHDAPLPAAGDWPLFTAGFEND